jgi:hypothetical protein
MVPTNRSIPISLKMFLLIDKIVQCIGFVLCNLLGRKYTFGIYNTIYIIVP